MSSSTPLAHAIHPLLASRWSPRSLLPEVLPADELDLLLEAARWAPSCFNAQPWDLIVAERGTPAFDAVLGALTATNQVWARNAAVLIVVAAASHFAHDGRPNRWGVYDAGAAGLSLCLQATALDLASHQMGGFDVEQVREATGLPASHTLCSVVAIGRPGPAGLLPEGLAARERAPRQRRASIAHHGRYGVERPVDPRIEAVCTFWFGTLDEHGMASEATSSRWFTVDLDFDEQIRSRFGALYDEAITGQLDGWASSARGRLALIVLLDQFSRNLFRDQGTMYAHDDRSLTLTLEGLELGLDTTLATQERMFFLMPLMHSEALADQELALAAFLTLAEEAPEPAREALDRVTDFARQHLAIVERWGRFPHRNARLGRPSSEAELVFLQTEGSSF